MQDLSLAFEAQLPNKLLKTKNLTGAENHSYQYISFPMMF